MRKQETTPHKKKVSKVKLFIIGAIVVLVGGIILGKVVVDRDPKPEPVVVDPTLVIGPIQDIMKETYVAGNPIIATITPEDEQGNFFYHEILGMKKVVELKYNVLVRWGYRGEIDEETVKYYEKEKILIIKEPQLTAFYVKELVESDEDLGWARSTSYVDAKKYDQQANTSIEQAIRNNIKTGRDKVQDYLKDEIEKLTKNGTIEVAIKEIYFEDSEEELNLVNEELENLEITEP